MGNVLQCVSAPKNTVDGNLYGTLPQVLPADIATKNTFIALYDFEAESEEELSFKKGHKFEITSNAGPWWEAVCLETNQHGVIPGNYVERYEYLKTFPWYNGVMNRSSADAMLLRNGRPGSFIVRKSETKIGQFTLSLHNETAIKHYHIERKIKGGWSIHKNVFADLPALVDYHCKYKDGLASRLIQACPRLDRWEIPREWIVRGEKLGEGNYSVVYAGIWNDRINVALKVLKLNNNEEVRASLLSEAETLRQLTHCNLVHIYGVCSTLEPIYIVLELVDKGSLLLFLKSSNCKSFMSSDLTKMAVQIASGLLYLDEKRLVHRDIAARNILVGEDLEMKISDFGLSRFLPEDSDEFVEETKETQFPFKWSAPETILDNIFSLKSDIWSFGITLDEIFSKGRLPYPGMNKAEVLLYIQEGGRLSKLDSYPELIYNIMKSCWDIDPSNRPTIKLLKRKLEDYRNQKNV